MSWIATLSILLVVVLLLVVGWMALSARNARRLSRELAESLWQFPAASVKLAQPTLFFESQVAELPEPVQSYFQWTLDDGVPVVRTARLQMAGRIRLGRDKPWMPHRSVEVISATKGFVWTANVEASPPIDGFDSFVSGEGTMEWWLMGLLPVMRASNPDITRAARWRFVAENVLLPGALLPGERVRWEPINAHSAQVTVVHDGVPHSMRFNFDPEGMPRKVSFERWGNFETADGVWQPIPYAVRCQGVFRKDGYSIPHQYTAYWWADTTKELAVVELEIVDAEFR